MGASSSSARSQFFGGATNIGSSELAKLEKKIVKQYPWLTNVSESMLVTDNRLPDCPIIYANDDFELMTRYPKEYIIGRNCRFLQGELTDQQTVTEIRTAVKEGKPLEAELLNYRRDGVPFLNVFLMLPVHQAKGSKKVTHFIAIQKDVSVLTLDFSPIDEWSSTKLGIMVDKMGLTDAARSLLQHKITGARAVTMGHKELIDIGILRRRERNELITWLKNPNREQLLPQTETSSYPKLGESFGEINLRPNLSEPRNLDFWRPPVEREEICLKCYYDEKIEVFVVNKKTTTFAELSNKLLAKFGYLMTVKYKLDDNTEIDVVDDASLHRVLSKPTGTLCLHVSVKIDQLQEAYDFVNNGPFAIVEIGTDYRLKCSNQTATSLLSFINGKTFSDVFGRSQKKLPHLIDKSFKAKLSEPDLLQASVIVTVSLTRQGGYSLSVLVMDCKMIS